MDGHRPFPVREGKWRGWWDGAEFKDGGWPLLSSPGGDEGVGKEIMGHSQKVIMMSIGRRGRYKVGRGTNQNRRTSGLKVGGAFTTILNHRIPNK